MGIRMGKFQQEYYNINDLDTGPSLAKSKDNSSLMFTESLKEDINLKDLFAPFNDDEKAIENFNMGKCPKCGQDLQEFDYCAKHGDIYEFYLAAKMRMEKNEDHGEVATKSYWKEGSAEAAADPAHYKDIVPGYEYMQLMEHLLGYEGTVSHLKGQIYKYLMRCGKKDDPYQEMLKVQWYSNYLTEMMKRKTNGDFPHIPEDTLGE